MKQLLFICFATAFLNTSAQNVGIGTSAPIGKLHIVHPGPTANLIIEHPTLDNFSRMLFTNTGASRSWGIAGKISGNINADILSLYNSGNAADIIAMSGNGYVGIGVANPDNRLQIGTSGGYVAAGLVIGNGLQAMAFQQNAGSSIWASKTNILINANDGNSNVGINTYTLPTNKFQIGSVGTTGFATNDLAIGNGTAAMAIHQSNSATLIGSTTDIILKPRNNGQGRVGINTTTPRAPLEVTSNTVVGGNVYSYLNRDAGAFGLGYCGSSCNAVVSIYASNAVFAQEFDAFSDARIKNILAQSNTANDLQIVNALQVTDYTMKDKVKYGDKPYKKVIAQDVEKVYPQVVSRHTEFVPNVYQATSKVDKTVDGYILSFTNKHTISTTAKKLRAVLSEEGGMQEYNIVSVPTEFQVTIKASGIKPVKVFVYGEEVDDFRTVDYEGLSTLNISATQELSKLVKKQQAQIEAQALQIASLVEAVKLLKENGSSPL